MIMGDEHGESLHLAACGLLVRVRTPALLLERLRALPRRVRTALGPPVPPPSMPYVSSAWNAPHPPGLHTTPFRRRVHQWRVIFTSRVVARMRPSVKAPVVAVFEPGALVWSAEPRADGWLPLTDDSSVHYLLIDATPLGLGVLLERIEPPILDEGACTACKAAPCCCALLASMGY